MEETKHTEKPSWEPFQKYMECPQCGNKSFNTDHDPNGREIVICIECNYEDDYTGFCADLIAAAPEMLEALKKVSKIRLMVDKEDWPKEVESAIAKAEPQ